MNAPWQPTGAPLNPLLVIRSEASGQSTAELVGVPEIRATAATREEAIQQVRQQVEQWLASGRLVPLESSREQLLREGCGWAKDDPLFGEYLEELARLRQEGLNGSTSDSFQTRDFQTEGLRDV